jgi:acetoin utilization deacetylase AcuC-like enzyme
MKAFYHDHFVLPLPENHRFPLSKYALLREKLVAEAIFSDGELLESDSASDEQLLRVHTPEYLEKVKSGNLSEKEIRRLGFPWSPQLVERSRRSVGGTLDACRAALQEGIAANLAGGTHHAHADYASGYCVFNDTAVAARAMQAEGLASRIAILDCDVHQGDGTADIFSGDPSVYTFSIHGASNFPFHKKESDLDMALPDNTGDSAYLEALEVGLHQTLDQAAFDLAIYLAGADPYAGDQLGRLNLSKNGLGRRDRLVFERCRQAGLPVAIVMAGGYARQVEDTVEIHAQSIKIAVEFAGHRLENQSAD